METEQSELCLGCLNGSRILQKVNVYSEIQCFLQIIKEIGTAPADMSLLLCWECAALLRKFTDFKQQVKQSYETLCRFTKQNITKTDRIPPRLNIKNVLHMYISPNNTVCDVTDIKEEDMITNEMKNEDIDVFNEFDSDVKDFNDLDMEINGEITSDIDLEVKDAKKRKKAKKKSHKESEIQTVKVNDTKKRHNDSNIGLKVNNSKKKYHDSNIQALKVNNTVNNKIIDEEIKEVKSEMYREVELTAEEVTEERRLTTLTEDYVNAMFRCERCIVTFPNEDDLKDHVRNKHELHSSKYKCSVCERTFASDISYNYHTGSHYRRYECAVCSSKFASKRGVTKHYNTTHCCGPELPSKTPTTKNGHIDKSIKQEYPCDYCEKSFKWKTSLRKHAEMHTIERGQKRKPYCEPCRLSFTNTSNLQKHVRTSSKHQIQLKLRKVQGSQEEVSKKVEQIKHAVTRSKQFYPCALCEKKFQWRGNLSRHLHTHATRAKGELVCEPCNRTFSSIATYKQHMKISKKHVSENEYKFMCSECGKRFANKIRLRDHLEYEHLKVFRHTCPICQKVFKCHTSLYLHKQLVHKKNNPEHLCDQCGKAFPNGTKLRTHITAAHSSVAPHTCTTCSARFRWHSCLSRHMRRVHHNNKQ